MPKNTICLWFDRDAEAAVHALTEHYQRTAEILERAYAGE